MLDSSPFQPTLDIEDEGTSYGWLMLIFCGFLMQSLISEFLGMEDGGMVLENGGVSHDRLLFGGAFTLAFGLRLDLKINIGFFMHIACLMTHSMFCVR